MIKTVIKFPLKYFWRSLGLGNIELFLKYITRNLNRKFATAISEKILVL